MTQTAQNDPRDETPTRLQHTNGGHVTVPAYKAERLIAAGLFSKPKPPKTSGTKAQAGGGDPAPSKYDDLKLDQLKDAIDERNDGREDDAKLPKTGNKADLVKVLVADDEAQV